MHGIIISNLLGGNRINMAIEVGQKIDGKITGLANFGAFIDIGNGKTGLVHISEVSDKFIENIKDELKVGQEVTVKVLSIADDGKIALSIRKAQENSDKGSDKNSGDVSSNKTHAKKSDNYRKKPNKSQGSKKPDDFDSLMNSFLKDSEDRLTSLKRNTENKRGGRGGRRS